MALVICTRAHQALRYISANDIQYKMMQECIKYIDIINDNLKPKSDRQLSLS